MINNLKKIIAISLTTLLLAGTAHAEGFFSKLFGLSDNGADLESLLVHVPADTAYLIANKEAIPEQVVAAHIARSKEILIKLKSSDDFKKATANSQGPGKFFIALLEEYTTLLANDDISEAGLSLEAKSVLYGFKMMPVLRIGVADKEKMMAMIKRAETKSSYQVAFSKCGEYDCFESADPKGKMAIAAVFLKDQLVLSAFSKEKKESLKKHLIGEAQPQESYTEANWDAFLEENNYPGYGDGFFNLKSAFNYAKPLIQEKMQGKMDNKSVDACLAVAEDHLGGLSGIAFGTKNLAEKVIDYEVLFKTSSIVSAALQTLANDTNIAQRTENAIFDFGVNINFAKLRDVLTQYSNFLIKSGETNKCHAIQAQEIRKGMGGMAMLMNMGLSQFNSIYASVSNFELDKSMQPKKIDAVISLGSNDPAGLLAMGGLVLPPLMSLDIPADGSVIKLPAGYIPGKGSASQPDLFLSRNEKAINIFVGNDKPPLKAYTSKTKEISFSSVDLSRYMEVFTSILESVPASAKKRADMPDLEMLKEVGDAGGRVQSTSSADQRGLVINYHIQY